MKENTFSSAYIGNKKGELRVMFYNIYGYKWWPDRENQPHLHSGPIPLRQQMQTELISAYAPDVLGMQEYCKAYHQGMTPLLNEAGYVAVEAYHTVSHPDGTPLNYTVLFYRPDRVKLIDKGFVMYPETMPDPTKDDGSVLNINDVSSKSLTWGVFEDLQTQKRFVAICTHFMYSAAWLTPEQRNSVRVQNAENLLKTVEEIRSNEAYRGLPVIMGGDLNTSYATDPFNTLQNGGMEWMYDVAEVKDESCGIKGYATYDEIKGEYVTCPMAGDDPRKAIDYAWMMQGEETKMKPFAYVTVTDRAALLTSDHCPRFTDFSLQ